MPTARPLPPNVAALLSVIDDAGTPDPIGYGWICDRLWWYFDINALGTQRAIRRAEAMGLVVVDRPNRAVADTWTVRRSEVPRG